MTFVSTWRLLADEKGSYAEYLQGRRTATWCSCARRTASTSRAPAATAWPQVVLDVIEKDWGMTGSASPARRRDERAARLPAAHPSWSSTQSRVSTSQKASPAWSP